MERGQISWRPLLPWASGPPPRYPSQRGTMGQPFLRTVGSQDMAKTNRLPMHMNANYRNDKYNGINSHYTNSNQKYRLIWFPIFVLKLVRDSHHICWFDHTAEQQNTKKGLKVIARKVQMNCSRQHLEHQVREL